MPIYVRIICPGIGFPSLMVVLLCSCGTGEASADTQSGGGSMTEASTSGTSGAGTTFESFGSGETSSSGSSTTFLYEPDPEPCCVKSCDVDSDCCPPEPELPSGLCPGDDFPHNWACVASVCVHGGCTADTDCVISGFVCRTVEGVSVGKRCVAKCASDAECNETPNMPGTRCIGESESTGFCIEDVPSTPNCPDTD